ISEVDGLAIVTPTEFKGFIKGNQANGLQWLSKKTIRTNITTNINIDSEENEYISISLRHISTKIKPIINGDNVKFDIIVKASGKVDDLQGNITKQEIRKVIAKQVKKEINDTY